MSDFYLKLANKGDLVMSTYCNNHEDNTDLSQGAPEGAELEIMRAQWSCDDVQISDAIDKYGVKAMRKQLPVTQRQRPSFYTEDISMYDIPSKYTSVYAVDVYPDIAHLCATLKIGQAIYFNNWGITEPGVYLNGELAVESREDGHLIFTYQDDDRSYIHSPFDVADGRTYLQDDGRVIRTTFPYGEWGLRKYVKFECFADVASESRPRPRSASPTGLAEFKVLQRSEEQRAAIARTIPKPRGPELPYAERAIVYQQTKERILSEPDSSQRLPLTPAMYAALPAKARVSPELQQALDHAEELERRAEEADRLARAHERARAAEEKLSRSAVKAMAIIDPPTPPIEEDPTEVAAHRAAVAMAESKAKHDQEWESLKIKTFLSIANAATTATARAQINHMLNVHSELIIEHIKFHPESDPVTIGKSFYKHYLETQQAMYDCDGDDIAEEVAQAAENDHALANGVPSGVHKGISSTIYKLKRRAGRRVLKAGRFIKSCGTSIAAVPSTLTNPDQDPWTFWNVFTYLIVVGVMAFVFWRALLAIIGFAIAGATYLSTRFGVTRTVMGAAAAGMATTAAAGATPAGAVVGLGAFGTVFAACKGFIHFFTGIRV